MSVASIAGVAYGLQSPARPVRAGNTEDAPARRGVACPPGFPGVREFATWVHRAPAAGFRADSAA
jgi:hypothetical protein